MTEIQTQIIAATETWLQQVVIGLHLCPFAAVPAKRKAIRFAVTEADTPQQLLRDLLEEIILLDETSDEQLETTLLIIPQMLQSFDDYNQFLNLAEELLEECDRDGIYQIASFHPDYCFAGSEPDAAENLTNRSPYPLLHLIREDLLEQALKYFPEPESIPEQNIRRVNRLSEQERRRLFPYLFT